MNFYSHVNKISKNRSVALIVKVGLYNAESFFQFLLIIFSVLSSRNSLKNITLLALELEFAQLILGTVFQLSRTWKTSTNSYFEILPIHQIIIPTKY